MKNKRAKTRVLAFVCLFFAIVFVFSIFVGDRTAHAATTARSMCVMETGSKRVLEGKNQQQKLPMASTTKIMTAITAIEYCKDLDEVFEIDPRAVGISGTSIYLRKGEKMSTKDLLYGLMLVSGNDAACAIACHVGGSEKEFVGLMNFLARKIGAHNTHFDNPHGLDSKTHYTTAYDLALITSYALQNDTFKEIVSTTNIKTTNSDGKVRYLRNKNKLLTKMEGCCGVKTGFTNDAGRCLVSACEQDGMTIVCVVLNCGPMFEESQTLLEEMFAKYSLCNLTKFCQIPSRLQIAQGKSEFVSISTKDDIILPLSQAEKEAIKTKLALQQNLEAPIDKGSEVGEVEIFINNDLHFSQKIYTMENVRRNSIWQKVKNFIDRW